MSLLLICIGYLSGLGRRWPRLLTGVAFFFGFWGGAGSYRRACMQKIKNLENSLLSDVVKMRESGGRFFPFSQEEEFRKLLEKHHERFQGAEAPEKPQSEESLN